MYQLLLVSALSICNSIILCNTLKICCVVWVKRIFYYCLLHLQGTADSTDSKSKLSEHRRSERKRKDRQPVFSPDDFTSGKRVPTSAASTPSSASSVAKKRRIVRHRFPAASAADRPYDVLPNGTCSVIGWETVTWYLQVKSCKNVAVIAAVKCLAVWVWYDTSKVSMCGRNVLLCHEPASNSAHHWYAMEEQSSMAVHQWAQLCDQKKYIFGNIINNVFILISTSTVRCKVTWTHRIWNLLNLVNQWKYLVVYRVWVFRPPCIFAWGPL